MTSMASSASVFPAAPRSHQDTAASTFAAPQASSGSQQPRRSRNRRTGGGGAVHLPSPTFTRERVRVQFHKTELCRYYRTGCRLGSECPFAHGQQELRQVPNLGKTSLCTAYENGTCPYKADRCTFAHGREELRRTDGWAAAGRAARERVFAPRSSRASTEETTRGGPTPSTQSTPLAAGRVLNETGASRGAAPQPLTLEPKAHEEEAEVQQQSPWAMATPTWAQPCGWAAVPVQVLVLPPGSLMPGTVLSPGSSTASHGGLSKACQWQQHMFGDLATQCMDDLELESMLRGAMPDSYEE